MALGKENPWITAWMMRHHVQWLILNQGISALSTLRHCLVFFFLCGGSQTWPLEVFGKFVCKNLYIPTKLWLWPPLPNVLRNNGLIRPHSGEPLVNKALFLGGRGVSKRGCWLIIHDMNRIYAIDNHPQRFWNFTSFANYHWWFHVADFFMSCNWNCPTWFWGPRTFKISVCTKVIQNRKSTYECGIVAILDLESTKRW